MILLAVYANQSEDGLSMPLETLPRGPTHALRCFADRPLAAATSRPNHNSHTHNSPSTASTIVANVAPADCLDKQRRSTSATPSRCSNDIHTMVYVEASLTQA